MIQVRPTWQLSTGYFSTLKSWGFEKKRRLQIYLRGIFLQIKVITMAAIASFVSGRTNSMEKFHLLWLDMTKLYKTEDYTFFPKSLLDQWFPSVVMLCCVLCMVRVLSTSVLSTSSCQHRVLSTASCQHRVLSTSVLEDMSKQKKIHIPEPRGRYYSNFDIQIDIAYLFI